MNKFVFLLTLVLILSLNSFSQEVRVLNLTNGLPISNVNVYNQEKNISFLTDSNGVVSLNDFKINELIYFSHSSFVGEKKTIAQIIEDNYIVYLFDEISLNPIIIKPPRENTYEDYSSVRMEKINLQEMRFSIPQTSADMLQKNANILVQKSQAGGGSPIIRGFEANKILLVVDGVRLNNAIYRSGHLQNAITIDNNILENTDVFYGPGSVIYGSDALGGVIHFHTKNPTLSVSEKPVFLANAMTRFGTANGENSGHIDFNYGKKNWASLTSVSFSSFKDFKMGKNRNHGYDDFGLIENYVTTINGIDSMVSNPDKNIHPRTGYNQLDLLQKFKFVLNEFHNIGVNLQYSTSTQINRFDKLNEYRDGQLRFAEWYYGPQQRLLTSLKLESTKETSLFDYYTLIGAYQNIDEDRIERRYRSNALISQREDVNVYSFNADFLKKLTRKEVLYYGVEFTHNTVKSTADEKDIVTGIITPSQTRYPNGENRITSMAIYGTLDKKITDKISVNLGGRFNEFINFSTFEDSSILDFPFSEIKFDSWAFSGSFSIKYQEENGFRAELIGSSGFRSPNVDDYGKIFEKDRNLIVPNNNLGPEIVYNGELNFSKAWTKKEREYLRVKFAGFYTAINNAIVRSNYQLNGEDSVMYRGEMVNLVSNQNVNSAFIYGGSFDTKIGITPFLDLSGSINYTIGRNATDDTTLSHIPPLFGKAALTYTGKKLRIQFNTLFNGKKNIAEYGPGTTDNPDEATIDGTPAWTIYNLLVSYSVSQKFDIQGSIENITDTHYKQFASGISGLGRNFSLTLRGHF